MISLIYIYSLSRHCQNNYRTRGRFYNQWKDCLISVHPHLDRTRFCFILYSALKYKDDKRDKQMKKSVLKNAFKNTYKILYICICILMLRTGHIYSLKCKGRKCCSKLLPLISPLNLLLLFHCLLPFPLLWACTRESWE